jgi:hypothetical protein
LACGSGFGPALAVADFSLPLSTLFNIQPKVRLPMVCDRWTGDLLQFDELQKGLWKSAWVVSFLHRGAAGGSKPRVEICVGDSP